MELDIKFDEAVDTEWEKLKHKESQYIIFKVSDDQTTVLLEKVGERVAEDDEDRDKKNWENFVNDMPKDAPRWAIFDLHLVKEDGATANKMIFIHYSPDAYFGSDKFFFATAKDNVAHHFVGINKSV